MIERCVRARINDQTGEAITQETAVARLHSRLHHLRKVAFSEFPTELKDVVFCSTGELSNPSALSRHMSLLSDEDLLRLAVKLSIVTDVDLKDRQSLLSRDFILDLILFHLSRGTNEIETLNQTSLYPTESILWDTRTIPDEDVVSESNVYPLPKLNLQFLSVYDYLLRNFELYRLESAYQIRLDLMDAIERINPVTNTSMSEGGARSKTQFQGWARRAAPLTRISMHEVSKPKIGQVIPGRVTCSIEVDISRFSGDVKGEWEGLRDHDVLFLVCLENPQRRPPPASGEQRTPTSIDEFMAEFGVRYVRGAEVYEMRDEEGVVLNDVTR
jgi:intron-binding protein aquarius